MLWLKLRSFLTTLWMYTAFVFIKNGATSLDLATDYACCEVLEHYTTVFMDLLKDPSSLVDAAVAHCAGFSAFH